MTVDVRPYRPDDADAAMAAIRASTPLTMVTPASLALESSDGRLLVATLDGGVAGVAGVRSSGDGVWTMIRVTPHARRRGLGGALLAAVEAWAAGAVVRTMVVDEPPSLAFAERRGYVRQRSVALRSLDLPPFAVPLPAPAPGVELRPGRDFPDPRPVYAIETEAAPDIPGHEPGDDDYDTWLSRTWNAPTADPDLTMVAVVDGEPAAYTVALSDGVECYWSAMTGTRRAYRGRGLATLVKVASLHRARSAGLTVAVTGNDDENAPMIAVNERLGYRRAATWWRYDKRP